MIRILITAHYPIINQQNSAVGMGPQCPQSWFFSPCLDVQSIVEVFIVQFDFWCEFQCIFVHCKWCALLHKKAAMFILVSSICKSGRIIPYFCRLLISIQASVGKGNKFGTLNLHFCTPINKTLWKFIVIRSLEHQEWGENFFW
jgi:hypothetical protein